MPNYYKIFIILLFWNSYQYLNDIFNTSKNQNDYLFLQSRLFGISDWSGGDRNCNQ